MLIVIIMSYEKIEQKWKNELINMDMDYGHHNPFKLIDSIKNLINSEYKKERSYHKKHKFIKNVWYCDTLKEYVYMLEKQLHLSLKQIKKLENGFDERNKYLKLEFIKR